MIVDETKTGVGDADIESARSESLEVSTSTDVVVELLDATGSVVDDVTSAEFNIVVPEAGAAGVGPGLMVTTKENPVAVEPLLRDEPSVQMTFPVAPTAGEVQLQPLGAAMEVNVVFGGVC